METHDNDCPSKNYMTEINIYLLPMSINMHIYISDKIQVGSLHINLRHTEGTDLGSLVSGSTFFAVDCTSATCKNKLWI